MLAKKDCKKKEYVAIGGQAVVEGVMMRGKRNMAICVLDENGNATLNTQKFQRKENFFTTTPFIRGFLSFIDSMVLGVKTLLKSAEADGETPTKKDSLIYYLAALIGLGLGVGLFFVLPSILCEMVERFILKSHNVLVLSLVEAFIRLSIMVLYLYVVSFVPGMNRTYMFHGAEHKTIACFEKGDALTIENIKRCERLHPRCGTSFLFFVILVSIVMFSLVNWVLFLLGRENNSFIKVLLRLALLPFVAGISYEILRALARANEDNLLVKILKAPGMALQRLTTREPDDQMIYIAKTAFVAVWRMENDDSIPATEFGVRSYKLIYEEVEQLIRQGSLNSEEFNCENGEKTLESASAKSVNQLNDDKSAREGEGRQVEIARLAKRIMDEAMGISKDVNGQKITIANKNALLAIDYAQKIAQGMPFERAVGNAEFYSRLYTLNEATLIPRIESELVVERAIKLLNEWEDGREASALCVLDLCCGSGCMGITIAKETGASVVCADISERALCAARANQGAHECISFIESDMFLNLANQKFDLIISNPPYVLSADLKGDLIKYDPVLALDGGEDGLKFYRILANEAKNHLNEGGKLVVEVGFDTGKGAKALFDEAGFTTTLIKDYSSNDRILICLSNA